LEAIASRRRLPFCLGTRILLAAPDSSTSFFVLRTVFFHTLSSRGESGAVSLHPTDTPESDGCRSEAASVQSTELRTVSAFTVTSSKRSAFSLHPSGSSSYFVRNFRFVTFALSNQLGWRVGLLPTLFDFAIFIAQSRRHRHLRTVRFARQVFV